MMVKEAEAETASALGTLTSTRDGHVVAHYLTEMADSLRRRGLPQYTATQMAIHAPTLMQLPQPKPTLRFPQ